MTNIYEKYGINADTAGHKVIEYMLNNGYITAMDGFKLKVTQVHTVICQLRKKGVPILCELVQGESKKLYGKWSLAENA